MTIDDHAARGTVSRLRRVIVGVIIVSFSIAAIGGIVVLVSGSLDETAGRVLGTTAVIGVFSVAVLCCAALIGRRLQIVGFVGAVVSVIAAALVVWLIWYRGPIADALFSTIWTAIAATAAFSLASLLLLLADRRQPAVRIGLATTLVLFAVVLALVIYLIWWPETVDSEVFPRVLGVVSILAALGAVVVPVISLLLRGRDAAGGLTHETLERIEAEAERRGVTPDALVASLLPPATPATAAAPTVPNP